jgi:hypothetical protein
MNRHYKTRVLRSLYGAQDNEYLVMLRVFEIHNLNSIIIAISAGLGILARR